MSGRHSNLVLTQGETGIEACAHQVGSQQSSMRQLQPGKQCALRCISCCYLQARCWW